jgi:hypothetical protein
MAQVPTQPNMLKVGLHYGGFDEHWQSRQNLAGRKAKFRSLYGSQPECVSQIWLTLQTTTIQAARIDATKTCPSELLMALYMLKTYSTENVMSGVFKQSNKTIRKVVWAMVAKLQALKAEKVCKIGVYLFIKPQLLTIGTLCYRLFGLTIFQPPTY